MNKPDFLDEIDGFADDPVREHVLRAVPTYGRPTTPMRQTAAQMIAEIRADGSAVPARTARPFQLRIPVAACVVLVVAAMLNGLASPTVALADSTPVPINVELPDSIADAAPWLALLTATATPLAPQRQPYLHLQHWTLTAGQETTADIYATDIKVRWVAAGVRRETIALPRQPARTQLATYTDVANVNTELQHHEPVIEMFNPGNYPARLGYPSSDPDVLAHQIRGYRPSPTDSPATSAQKVLRAIAHLNASYALGAAEHRSILTVLSHADGLVYRGTVTDRAGRMGIAISADAVQNGTRTRDLLVIDPSHGTILSHETAILADRHSLVTLPAVTAYTLYLQDISR